MQKVSIAPLLTTEDYNAWWAGENGAEGYMSPRVEQIWNLGGQGEIQIWDKGSATIEVANAQQFISAVQAEFNIELDQ